MAFLANKSDLLSLVPLLQKIMTGRGVREQRAVLRSLFTQEVCCACVMSCGIERPKAKPREPLLDRLEERKSPTAAAQEAFDFRRHSMAELMEVMYNALTTLLPRERELLVLRYSQEGVQKWTLQALGERFGGISRERVRQIEANALKKLRKAMVEQLTANK